MLLFALVKCVCIPFRLYIIIFFNTHPAYNQGEILSSRREMAIYVRGGKSKL